MQETSKRKRLFRRGVVAVEFAVALPVLLLALFGMAEATRLYETKNLLATAIRAGSRLAAMDREGMVADGQTTNQKVINDIRHFLTTSMIPEDQVTILVTEVGNLSTSFDLDALSNNLRLFQVHVEVPYYAPSSFVIPGAGELTLSADLIMRNAQSALIQ